MELRAIDLVLNYARPSLRLEEIDRSLCKQLASAIQDWMRSRAEMSLMVHRHKAVVLQYGADCTPLVTRRRYTMRSGDLAVQRTGSRVGEWLVQRACVLASTGERIVILAQPRILADKSAWSHFACWREFLPLPREYNARGLVLHHHVYDRAIFASVSRHQLQMHSLCADAPG